MKPIRYEVRDLHASHPEDYTPGTLDVLVHCDDGTRRYTDALYYSSDEAQIAICGFERMPPDALALEQWEIAP